MGKPDNGKTGSVGQAQGSGNRERQQARTAGAGRSVTVNAPFRRQRRTADETNKPPPSSINAAPLGFRMRVTIRMEVNIPSVSHSKRFVEGRGWRGEGMSATKHESVSGGVGTTGRGSALAKTPTRPDPTIQRRGGPMSVNHARESHARENRWRVNQQPKTPIGRNSRWGLSTLQKQCSLFRRGFALTEVTQGLHSLPGRTAPQAGPRARPRKLKRRPRCRWLQGSAD